MRRTVVLLAPLLSAPLQAQERTVVFTNVRVIPMDRERVMAAILVLGARRIRRSDAPSTTGA